MANVRIPVLFDFLVGKQMMNSMLVDVAQPPVGMSLCHGSSTQIEGHLSKSRYH